MGYLQAPSKQAIEMGYHRTSVLIFAEGGSRKCQGSEMGLGQLYAQFTLCCWFCCILAVSFLLPKYH